jgi:hypothetical protein
MSSLDTNFFVSGTIDSAGTAVRGTGVFGGDLYVSGNLSVAGSLLDLYRENAVLGHTPPTATGDNAVAIGDSCTAVGDYSFIGGGQLKYRI